MCLIVASDKGVMPDMGVLEHAYVHNPHGWGIAYHDGTRVRVDKGFNTERMLEACKRVDGKPYVLHFRYATHGVIDRSNTHPFKVADGTWMAHNGIIKINCPNKKKSDTWHFAKLVALHLKDAPDVYGTKEFITACEDYVGRGSKLTFIGPDAKIHIANEGAGEWIGEMWFSNTYSLPDWFAYGYKSESEYLDTFRRRRAYTERFTYRYDTRWDTKRAMEEIVDDLKYSATRGCKESLEELEAMGIQDFATESPSFCDIEDEDELPVSFILDAFEAKCKREGKDYETATLEEWNDFMGTFKRPKSEHGKLADLPWGYTV